MFTPEGNGNYNRQMPASEERPIFSLDQARELLPRVKHMTADAGRQAEILAAHSPGAGFFDISAMTRVLTAFRCAFDLNRMNEKNTVSPGFGLASAVNVVRPVAASGGPNTSVVVTTRPPR